MKSSGLLNIGFLFIFLVSCRNEKQNELSQLSRIDTNQVLQVVITAFKANWQRTFEGQNMRILPNKFIRPGTKLLIEGRPVTYPQADSSLMDSVFAEPKFFATINIFRFPTDSTAHIDLTFQDTGKGGEFRLLKKPKKIWVIVNQQFYKI
ncbi:hypothetical protein [Larkinella soli]|uniref:hypothetical protein n=1 Tax=Larkinella soli TaxID=1770527 RepID=UPI000FFC74F7|nr:hypothetical protein [Larkinella soli]